MYSLSACEKDDSSSRDFEKLSVYKKSLLLNKSNNSSTTTTAIHFSKGKAIAHEINSIFGTFMMFAYALESIWMCTGAVFNIKYGISKNKAETIQDA